MNATSEMSTNGTAASAREAPVESNRGKIGVGDDTQNHGWVCARIGKRGKHERRR